MNMKQITTIALLLLSFTTQAQKIKGTVTQVNKDTITVNDKRFIVLGNVPDTGIQVTFIPTRKIKK